MCDPTASPNRIAMSTAVWFSTGNTPGIPRQIGSVAAFGSAPNVADDHEKIFDRAESWQWTSRPMTGSYFTMGAGPLFCRRKENRIVHVLRYSCHTPLRVAAPLPTCKNAVNASLRPPY